MDLAQFSGEKPEFVHLRHPESGEPLYDEETKEPVGVELWSMDSDAYARIEHADSRKAARRMIRGRSFDSVQDDDYESAESDETDRLVMLTRELKNVILSGEKLDSSRESIRRFYEEVRFARRQVRMHLNKRLLALGN